MRLFSRRKPTAKPCAKQRLRGYFLNAYLGKKTTTSTPGARDATQQITWLPVPGAVRYDVMLGVHESDVVTVQTDVGSPYTFTGLPAGTHRFGVIGFREVSR